ncbi:ribonuclease P protein component [Ilumatobacter sp.]|uniref:ribonuclease P protein component n=1 Tax=Ilumatobacter sp. TaxID=1967498 RepID=UPI003C35E9BC
MIGRIRARDDFQRLRRDGRRVRIEPFWCSHLPDPSSDVAQVAFAINRAVGNAVTRNRLRRRLRAVLAEMELTGGLYLIGCRPSASELTFAQIRVVLAKLPPTLARQATQR